MHENLGTTLSMDHHFKEFQALGAATVYEASGQEGALDSGIKPVNPASRMCGRAITLELDPADNWYIERVVPRFSCIVAFSLFLNS